MTRAEKALELKAKGYNCCQCTVCAFAEELGADYNTIFKASEGLGAGMGCQEGACGAVSGAIMAIGLKTSTCQLDAPNSKEATYKLATELYKRFEEKNGSVICKDLKGTETGKVLRECPGCIQDAVELAEEILGLK